MRDWFGFDPLQETTAMREALRQLLSERPDSPYDFAPSALASVFVPIDVMDAGPEIIVRANLPGMKPDDISIHYLNNTLTIKGDVKEDMEFQGATYLRHERRAAGFSRSINLPMALEMDGADAKFQDGVLTLHIPKSEKIRPKTIKINAAG